MKQKLHMTIASDVNNTLVQFASEYSAALEALEVLSSSAGRMIGRAAEIQTAHAGREYSPYAMIEAATLKQLSALLIQTREQFYATLAQSGIERAMAREMLIDGPAILTPARPKLVKD